MAHPFRKQQPEKLNSYDEERVNSNSKQKETNQRREKATGNKLSSISRRLQTKRLREIKS